MLVEICCDKFRQGRIEFNEGLNVVLGDDIATNSIGKSSLLMVVDFVFGGSSLLDHNQDIVEELGHHEYRFSLRFNKNTHYFTRSTHTPDLLYKCNDQYEEDDPISAEQYRAFLKTSYGLSDIDLTFRSIVSLYSRVWGKENLDVKQPLHSFKKQTSLECIDTLLKLFGQFESVSALSARVKQLTDEKKTIGGAFRQELIPKITKTKYKSNVKRITEISDELDDIKKNLAAYAVNINEIVDREMAELKGKKDELLAEKSKISARLNRVKQDLSKNRHVASKAFSVLVDYFPDVNQERLVQVEEFHSKITKILRDELRSSEKNLSETLLNINQSISKIDEEISRALENIENPTVIVDRVHDLSKDSSAISAEIDYFETEDRVKTELKEIKSALTAEKARVLKFVQDIVNNKTRQFVSKIYSEERRSPVLELSEKSYTFTAVEDTGTGKAYSNLIVFDLAIMDTTILPFVIHDSVLFKNVENEAIARLIPLYDEMGKQSFISIDEIKKYGEQAEAKLRESKVIQLTNNEVLYVKDWRK